MRTLITELMNRLVHTRFVLALRDLEVSTRFYIDVLGCKRDFGEAWIAGASYLATNSA
jgi:hypothetical protein